MTTETEEIDMTSLTLTPTESVKVRTSTPEVIEVEVTYGPGSRRPPAHLHPHQDESFQVLSGTIGVRPPRNRPPHAQVGAAAPAAA